MLEKRMQMTIIHEKKMKFYVWVQYFKGKEKLKQNEKKNHHFE